MGRVGGLGSLISKIESKLLLVTINLTINEEFYFWTRERARSPPFIKVNLNYYW